MADSSGSLDRRWPDERLTTQLRLVFAVKGATERLEGALSKLSGAGLFEAYRRLTTLKRQLPGPSNLHGLLEYWYRAMPWHQLWEAVNLAMHSRAEQHPVGTAAAIISVSMKANRDLDANYVSNAVRTLSELLPVRKGRSQLLSDIALVVSKRTRHLSASEVWAAAFDGRLDDVGLKVKDAARTEFRRDCRARVQVISKAALSLLEPYASAAFSPATLLDAAEQDRSIGALLDVLTPTERRVASLVLRDLDTAEIADDLNMAPATVRVHKHGIRKKLSSS